jgi:hypothetical protein
MRATCPAHLIPLELTTLKHLAKPTSYEALHYSCHINTELTCDVPSSGRKRDVIQLHRAVLLLTRVPGFLGGCRLLNVVL